MHVVKRGYFRDYENRVHSFELIISDNNSIGIKTYDMDGNKSGFMYLGVEPGKRIFLNSIYCYSQYRRSGIATIMNDLASYFYKHYYGYLIYGAFQPYRAAFEDTHITNEELSNAAKSFYEKTGYKIVTYSEYLDNKDKYKGLKCSDFLSSEEFFFPKLVVKKIRIRRHPFYEKDGIIYHENYKKGYRREKSLL